jgi:hypothetical protein
MWKSLSIDAGDFYSSEVELVAVREFVRGSPWLERLSLSSPLLFDYEVGNLTAGLLGSQIRHLTV